MAQNIFSKESLAISKAYKGILAKVAATAVNFSKERFVQGNWLDRVRKAWKQRSILDTGEGTKGFKRRGILVRTGQLKKSIRLIGIRGTRIIIGSDVVYAKIHNEGGIINQVVSVRQHKRKMAKRSNTGRGVFNIKSKKELMKLAQSSGTVKAHNRKMNLKIPQRQYMGPSAILERRIERVIEKEIKQALKSI